ncbi:MAG: sulfotransferase domain-containing protein [Chloroflexota bacterium]
MSKRKVLQIGVPRSGNLWVHRIIARALEFAEPHNERFVRQFRRFIEANPIRDLAQLYEHDVIVYSDDECFFKPDRFSRIRIDDFDAFLAKSDHVWTHSAFTDLSYELLPKFDKVVYIIRDPRDVIVSLSRFLYTPGARDQLRPSADSPQEYLNNVLANRLLGWVSHVGGYLGLAEEFNIHVVFYERLNADLGTEMDSLLDFLELRLDHAQVEAIKHEVSFASMKHEKPHHLRQGRAGTWDDLLTVEQRRQGERIAGPMLSLLGYPVTADELGQRLPSMTPGLTEAQFRHAVDEAQAAFRARSLGGQFGLNSFLKLTFRQIRNYLAGPGL